MTFSPISRGNNEDNEWILMGEKEKRRGSMTACRIGAGGLTLQNPWDEEIKKGKSKA